MEKSFLIHIQVQVCIANNEGARIKFPCSAPFGYMSPAGFKKSKAGTKRFFSSKVERTTLGFDTDTQTSTDILMGCAMSFTCELDKRHPLNMQDATLPSSNYGRIDPRPSSFLQCLVDMEGLQWGIPYYGYLKWQQELNESYSQKMQMYLMGSSEESNPEDYSRPKKMMKYRSILEYNNDNRI
jgi:hypothetical protein